jgi:hypothetical protein
MNTQEIVTASDDMLKTVKNVKEASEIVKTIDPTAASFAIGIGILGAFMAPQLSAKPEPKTIDI